MTLTTLADRDPHGTTTPCYVRPFTARIVEFAEANFPVFIRHDSFLNSFMLIIKDYSVAASFFTVISPS